MPDPGSQPDVVGRLLEGRDGFSQSERRAIFDDVFDEVNAEASATAIQTKKPWWGAILAMAAAIAIAFVAAQWIPRSQQDEFTARGESTNLQLLCTGDADCASGDALTFELSGAEHPFFAAFARVETGTVVWYFPETPGGQSIMVEDGHVSRSVRLGPEHEPGTWTVYAILSPQPLTRDAVRASFDDDGGFELEGATLLTRELVIR